MAEKTKTIHCAKCGREMSSAGTVYEYDSKYLGRISVPCHDGELYVCDCGESPYVKVSLSKRAEEFEQKRIEQLLLLSVGGDMAEFKKNLIGMSELEEVLGVSRQAISKSPKYRNRIYHVVINGDILWWKPSVSAFKTCADGRISFVRKGSSVKKGLKAVVNLLNGFFPRRSAAMFSI